MWLFDGQSQEQSRQTWGKTAWCIYSPHHELEFFVKERKTNGFSISFFPRQLPLFFFFLVVVCFLFFVLFPAVCMDSLFVCIQCLHLQKSTLLQRVGTYPPSFFFFPFGGAFLFSFLTYSHLFHVLHARASHREARKKENRKNAVDCERRNHVQTSSVFPTLVYSLQSFLVFS